jgi:four helix bundle protein
MFNFEKLDAWQKAIDFADLVYSETQAFPTEERFGLTNQLRRAAISISSNIAERSSRSSKNDLARFAEIAAGSVFEAVPQAFIARRQSFFECASVPEDLRRCRRVKPNAKRFAKGVNLSSQP